MMMLMDQSGKTFDTRDFPRHNLKRDDVCFMFYGFSSGVMTMSAMHLPVEMRRILLVITTPSLKGS